MDHEIFERAIQKRKEALEESIRSAEAEYRNLVAEVRDYNNDVYSCMEKEFRTVKTLSNELVSCHVTREKKKRVRKKHLVQKQGHKIASRSGSSSKSASKLSTKQKDVRKASHKAKHKTSTSQALPNSIPGTHLTPLLATTECSTEDGIDAILAAGTHGPESRIAPTSSPLALPPPPVPKVPSASGISKVTSAPTHKQHSPSVTCKVTSPTLVSKVKHDSFGKAGTFSFNKGSKHDVQLFTILDTTVSPPLPRYIAKIVPESTALIPLSSSSARNPPKVGSALSSSTSAHSTISSTHSTSSPAPTLSSSAHLKSMLTTAIPRLSGSSAQSKSSTVTGTDRRSAHKDDTSSSAVKSKASITAPTKKVITPITPPTVYTCDQPGCRASFSQAELLNLHKLTFHRLLPQLTSYVNPATRHNGSLVLARSEVVTAAAHTLVDGSKKIIEKVSSKRVHRSPSGSEGDSGRKFIKLESGQSSTSPLHNTAPKPWRNFARKSTGQHHSLKRKRVCLNRMQLKLTKVSTKGRKMPKTANRPIPMSHSRAPHGYRNPEFFRNLIRSQLKLPTTNQKATATSDYISLQPDTEPMSVKQTNKVFPGPGPACKESEDDSLVCARALPFIGNCARTRKFTPVVFGKPKKLSEQDHMMSSSSSSISTSMGEEIQAPSSEDESFPLVALSPMGSRQLPCKESSTKIPQKMATYELHAASPQPLSMDKSAGAVHNVGWEGMVQSPPEHEKIQQKTRISVDPLPCVSVSTKPKSPVVKSPAMLSPGGGNNEYTMRLLQTIAKLSGDASLPKPSCDAGEKSRKSSVLSPPPPVTEGGDSGHLDDEPCTSLVISVDLSRLSRIPVPPPCPSETEVGVFTHRLGSFVSRGAQVERGLIIDSDDLECRLTVKVNEALCEMKEKLKKTERRVREVMKEKEQLEKILEAKLKMIKDLTTTGLKPVFADKETMTDPDRESTEVTGNKKVKSNTKSTSTQTVVCGARVERRTVGPSRCLSHLSNKELEEYLRLSPPTSAAPSEDDGAIDVSSDVVPASSKNKWMFEWSDSARSSAFNLQVRFMRALMQNADGQNKLTPSSMVSSSLLSRDLCSTFTKIQRLNQQLQVLPLVSVLKEKVDVVTSNVNHLLSHLPLPKGAEYEDLVLQMKLSVGTSAYNVGWKIKELLALLMDINADCLPAYFKAELKLVTRHVQNALQFGESGMKNVTVDHTLRPLKQAPIIRLIDDDLCDDYGDFDLDGMLSSSDDDDEKHQRKVEEAVEIGGDQDLAPRPSKPTTTTVVRLGDRHNDRSQKKHRRREKRIHSTKERKPRHSMPSLAQKNLALVKGKQSLWRGYGGKFVKTSKAEKSKASKASKRAPLSEAVSNASNSPVLPPTDNKLANHVDGAVDTRTPLILRKPTAVASTPSSGGSSVTVTPINGPLLSKKDLLEPIKLLTSLAATMISKGIPVGEAVTTSTVSVSQPRVTPSANTAVSSTTSSQTQGNSVGTSTVSGMCMSGRVEASNLSSNTFTPIVKALSPTSTSPSGLHSVTTPFSSKNQQVSAVSTAPRGSQVRVTVLPSAPPSSSTSASLSGSNTVSSPTLNLSSSTLPPAVIAASSLLSLPPGPWNRLPISVPPSVVTASAIPALQNSARQGRTQSLTNAPAPLMRSSTLNSFPAPVGRVSRLATPSVTSPPSVNRAPMFSLPVMAVNVSPLLSTPMVFPSSGRITVASSMTTPTASIMSSDSVHPVASASTTPTVAPPSIVATASSCTPTAETIMTSPPVNTSPSSSASSSIISTTTVSAPSGTSSPAIVAVPSDTSDLSSEASSLPVWSSTTTTTSSIAAATPTTCTVTPVEGMDILPDLPETNNSTTVVVIDPSPEADLPETNNSTTVVVIDPSPPAEEPPSLPRPATVSDTSVSSSGNSPGHLAVSTAPSDPTDSKCNPAAVSLSSSLSSSKSKSVALTTSSSSTPKASASLEDILSSSSALLTSIASQGLNTPQSASTTVSRTTGGGDSSLVFLDPQRFQYLLAQCSTHPIGMANREQSMSQGIHTLSSLGAGLRQSPRIKNKESISPSVAALKAAIFKSSSRRNSPPRTTSAPSSTKPSSVQESHRLVALSPSPLSDTCVNHVTTTLNAHPTLEDLKTMYSPQSPVDGTTGVSTAASTTAVSSCSAATAVIVIDDDGDKHAETAASPEDDTTKSASVCLSTAVSRANSTTSTESRQSSVSPSENSTPESDKTPVSQELSPISSPSPDSVVKGDLFVFPVGVNSSDITPLLQVMHDTNGVLIKWTLPKKYLKLQEGVTIYELYAYIVKGGTEEDLPPVSEWSKVGKVKPLRLPMAVTLTNVVKSKKYFFSVRALFGSESCATRFSKPSSFQEEPKLVGL